MLPRRHWLHILLALWLAATPWAHAWMPDLAAAETALACHGADAGGSVDGSTFTPCGCDHCHCAASAPPPITPDPGMTTASTWPRASDPSTANPDFPPTPPPPRG